MDLLKFPDTVLAIILQFCSGSSLIGTTCKKLHKLCRFRAKIYILENRNILKHYLENGGSVPQKVWARECQKFGEYPMLISECTECPRFVVSQLWELYENYPETQFYHMLRLKKFQNSFVGPWGDLSIYDLNKMLETAAENNNSSLVELLCSYCPYVNVLHMAIYHIVNHNAINILDYFKISHELVFLHAIQLKNAAVFDWAVENNCTISRALYYKLLSWGEIQKFKKMYAHANFKLQSDMYIYALEHNSMELAELFYKNHVKIDDRIELHVNSKNVQIYDWLKSKQASQ